MPDDSTIAQRRILTVARALWAEGGVRTFYKGLGTARLLSPASALAPALPHVSSCRARRARVHSLVYKASVDSTKKNARFWWQAVCRGMALNGLLFPVYELSVKTAEKYV